MFDVCTLLICLYRVHLLLSNHTLSKKECASSTCFLVLFTCVLYHPQQSVEYALAASTVEYARVIAAASPGCTTHQGTARRITPSTNTPANQKGIWVELLVFCVQLACGACIYRYATHATTTAMAHTHAKRDNIPIQVRFRSPKSKKKSNARSSCMKTDLYISL